MPKYSGKNLILYKKALLVYMKTVPFMIMEIDIFLKNQKMAVFF